MKSIYSIVFTLSIGFWIQAQSLNPGFENWHILQNQIQVSGTATVQGFTANYEIDDPQFSYNEVVSWSSLNQLTGTQSIAYTPGGSSLVELVTQSSDVAEGSSSIRLESDSIDITADVEFFGPITIANVAPGLLISGELTLDVAEFADELISGGSLNSLNPFTYEKTGQPIDFQPGKLMGSYKYTGVSGDSAMLVSGLIKDRVVVAYVIKRLPNAATWTNFELEYQYLSCAMPDTIISLFCSSNLDATFDNGNFLVNSNYTGVDGSVLFLDGLQMDTIDTSVFPPLAFDDFTSIFDNEIATVLVTDNDDFCGGTAPAPVLLSTGANGNASVQISNEVEYTPNQGFSGIDTITYYVCNDSSLCDTADWYITVSTVPVCVAVDDIRSLPSNGSSVFDATANDNDCGTFPDITVLPVNGVANVETNGNISYSPLVGFVGMDSLTYRICSPIDSSQCSSAKVYYDVLTTGIREIPNQQLSIRPNPANSYVEIASELEGSVDFTLMNLLGQEIQSGSFVRAYKLNLEEVPSGVYLLKFEQDDASSTKKLVVKK